MDSFGVQERSGHLFYRILNLLCHGLPELQSKIQSFNPVNGEMALLKACLLLCFITELNSYFSFNLLCDLCFGGGCTVHDFLTVDTSQHSSKHIAVIQMGCLRLREECCGAQDKAFPPG